VASWGLDVNGLPGLERKALLWRRRQALKLLAKEPTIDRLGLLAAIVCPDEEFLARSLEAVREKEAA
jgi:hypothetical protein